MRQSMHSPSVACAASTAPHVLRIPSDLVEDPRHAVGFRLNPALREDTC